MALETSIVLTTVADFIDYAMLVVGILAAVYLIRFLLAVRETTAPDRKAKDAEWEARGAAGREWIGKKYEKMKKESDDAETERKAKKEKKWISDMISPLVDRIYNKTAPLVNKIKTELAKKERDSALSSLEELKDQAHSLWRQLRSLRHAVPEDKKDKVKDTMEKVDALKHVIEAECIAHLPKKSTASDWDTQVTHIKSKLDVVKSDLGAIYNELKALYS